MRYYAKCHETLFEDTKLHFQAAFSHTQIQINNYMSTSSFSVWQHFKKFNCGTHTVETFPLFTASKTVPIITLKLRPFLRFEAMLFKLLHIYYCTDHGKRMLKFFVIYVDQHYFFFPNFVLRCPLQKVNFRYAVLLPKGKI